MDGPTQFVEIPGYSDALKREDELRRKAWTGEKTVIAGVPVRALTWRDVETLAAMRNGLFCPWRFDTDAEFLGHCAQLVWWLSDCRKDDSGSRIGALITMGQRERLIRHLAQHPVQLADGVKQYLEETFMDSPRGDNSSSGAALAGGAAYIADTLAAGGYSMTFDEILDTPLVRLFQILRLIRRRVYGETLTNPSDKIATEYLARQGRN